MSPRRRVRRIIIRGAAVLVIGLLVLVAALPLWLPWVLRPATKSLNLRYTAYERVGYNRFRLTGVSMTTKAGEFRAKQAEGLVPTTWLSRVFTGGKGGPYLDISDWSFVYQPASTNTRPAAPSVYTNIQKFESTLDTLGKWVPNARLTNGVVRLKNFTVTIPSATWTTGTLSGSLVFQTNRSLDLQVVRHAGPLLTASFASKALDLRSEFSVVKTDSELRVAGTAFWLTNRIELAAAFARQGVLPRTASVRADAFEVPAHLLKLERYKNLTGSLGAVWRTNRFALDLTAHASPESPGLPPVEAEARVAGDTNSAVVETARASAPGLEAKLSDHTKIQFQPPFLSEPAALNVSADLAQQPWLTATGTLHGSARLFPVSNRFPRVTFTLAGNGLALSNFQTETLGLEGEFEWPDLRLATARLKMADGSEARLAGSFNLPARTLTNGVLNYSGAFGRQFLPAGYSFGTASTEARFEGPLAGIAHSGKLEVKQLQIPRSKPLQLDAQWTGRRRAFEKFGLTVSTTNATLQLHGSADIAGNSNVVAVSMLSLRTSDSVEMNLDRPFHAAFHAAAATNGWTLRIQQMRWAGSGRELSIEADIDWPAHGDFQVAARDLESGLVRDFVQVPEAGVRLNRLDLTGGWTNGPFAFVLETSAETSGAPYPFSARANVIGGTDGISIQQLTVSSTTQVVAHARGRLPLVVRPGGTNGVVDVNANGPLELQAFTETNSTFWTELAARSGIQIVGPQLTANVTGTWANPDGHVALMVERIQFPGTNRPLPTVTNLDFQLDVNRDDAAVLELNARVEGQPLTIVAEVPLGRSFWSGLSGRRQLPDWRDITARLEMEDAQLAPFAEFIPKVFVPQGEATVNLRLERGEVRGEVAVRNARTHPVATFGPIRNIEATARFEGHTVVLTNLHAEIGGQPVDVHGRAMLPDEFWKRRELPPFQLFLRGTNVPLARKPGVLLRANLDVAITNSTPSNGIVTGTVRLTNSFYFSDLKDLVPGKVASAKRHPPYFSIITEPFARWRLAAHVEGDRFLKVQSPIFRGTVSTSMRLEGTLKDPIALGDVRVNSGAVTFPFGNLDVQQGFVTLTSDNPYRPQLFVMATAQRMGYDIKMEVTGPADQPVIQFSSTPPLSSEQILLMLTTGQLPPGLASTTTRQRAQGLALFVGRNLLFDLGIGGNSEGRLTIRSGEQVTEAGRPTYEVEYKFTDDWSAVGEYDRFGDYNLGLKWKVYSK